MKKIFIKALIISMIGCMTGCSFLPNRKENPLSGKNTDERIIMCLEETYPEHQFDVVESFDKKRNKGIFEDEEGVQFEVHSLLYDNTCHFGCKDEYLSGILKQENYIEKAKKIAEKYNQKISYSEGHVSLDIILDDDNQISVSDVAKIVLEILNSVEVPEVKYHKETGFSTNTVNYYTSPVWGILQCNYEKDDCKTGTRFYFEDKTKDSIEIEEKLHVVLKEIDELTEEWEEEE